MIRSLHLTICLALVLASASLARPVDALVEELGGTDEVAQYNARQQLARENPIDVVPKILPLFSSENPSISWAACNTISDLAAESSMPGREAERQVIAKAVLTLVAPQQPEFVKVRALRLLPIVVPAGMDVSPIAALLADDTLRDKARSALEEMDTPEAAAALREYLRKADPAFQPAILVSLGMMRDAATLDLARGLTASNAAAVRAAAVYALAWAGNPSDLAAARKLVESADDASRSEAFDAYMRLVNAVEINGGNWETAVAEYKRLTAQADPLAIEAGLAGLGRIGDGSCVATVLDVASKSKDRTFLMAVDALRTMQGVDVVRQIVDAYPKLTADLQVAILPVLGGKRHPLIAPVLTEAAKSSDAPMRKAALIALGESALPEATAVLAKAANEGPEDERAATRCGLLQLADGLRAAGKTKEAGAAYAIVYAGAGEADKVARGKAVQGLAACPVVEGYDAAKAVAADKDAPRDLAIPLLVGTAGALTEAGQNDKALELYDHARRLSPPMDVVQQIVKGMTAAGANVDVQGLLGIVTNWWVVGPFELGEQNKGWNEPYIGEPDVNLVAKYMTGKRRVQWTQVVSKDPQGKIDMRKTVADTDNAIGYAYTEITVPEATDAVLHVGVDDSERIWLNGQQVFELWVARGLTPDADKVPVKLQAGVNKILMKIWQNSMGWEFCMRITLPDGHPVQFTQEKK